MNRSITILAVLILSGCSTISALEKEPELHSIGIYEGVDPDDDGIPWQEKCGGKSPLICHRLMNQRKNEIGGQVVVNVSMKGKPLVLGFSAYDKTKWIVKAEKGVLIEKVILGGYHSQTIEGISLETPVEVYTYDSSPCARCYKGNFHFYSYKGVPKQLEKISGLSAKSWQGKYKGNEFSIFPGMKRLEKTK